MRKLRLDLDDLAVDSFDTRPEPKEGRGTVLAHESGMVGCVNYATYEYASCDYSACGGTSCAYPCGTGGSGGTSGATIPSQAMTYCVVDPL